ncbi:hypothetical protein CSB08_01355 [Candidatus Gracilibacteria bacterium]|nr:MAG: hypothetical protein CSB08_01355 [Candidatus Gracilibacteria bacterium]PIE85384.1 MAG: hypothetical protein CSA08_02290 [Candidatus Gracilibacteria bacterium]
MLANKKKNLVILSILCSFLIIGALIFYLYNKSIKEENNNIAKEINNIINANKHDIKTCRYAFGFKNEDLNKNKFLSEDSYLGFLKYKSSCDKKYNIKNLKVSFESCSNIIKKDKKFFEEKYIFLDDYEQIKKECYKKFLSPKFSTGTFFDPENDFKSTVYLDFGVDFYEDKGESGDEEFLENRSLAKEKLIDIIEISPNVKLSKDDIVLYKKKAIINLKLKSLSAYKLNLKTNKDVLFTLNTPENKYLGLKILDKVSLYMDNKPPRFKLVEFNSGKEKVDVKICRVSNENYTKIEILRSRPNSQESKEFFKTGIDNLKVFECKSKTVEIKDDNIFNFDSLIGEVSRSGLYYVTFDNYIDREFNGRIQYPIFFGIIDSHITMKVSKTGQGFFFVNDFDGKPLPNQEIRIYLNDFKSHEKKWDRTKYNKRTKRNGDYVITEFSPFDKDVLSKEIFLGKTNKFGILEVNLKEKIKDAFDRTFGDSWDYDYSGIDKSFFVTSSSKGHLSYNHSKWNAGIAPWNFGYSIGGWWLDDNNGKITLDRWSRNEPDFYSYTYTDRVLYLPGEKVNFKSVLRKSKDLSVPSGKDFVLKIHDSDSNEIYNKKLKANSYGSIYDNVILSNDSPLGDYIITIFDKNDKVVGRSSFSVEVFKNPKFKVELSAEAIGLESGMVKIDKETKVKHNYWTEEKYEGKFSIKSRVSAKYYNGGNVSKAKYKYKVYKQYYYDNSFWDDCYYGCYWEPRKELYTSGEGVLDENGIANIKSDISFSSSYDDYKYIVEVTVIDSAGDSITGSNSIIAKMPEKFKKWYGKADLFFETDKKFYESSKEFVLKGGLNTGKWSKYYDNKYILVVKRKVYKTDYINDIKGYKRPITKSEEKIEDIILINSENFEVGKDGRISIRYKAKNVGEYIFEWGKISDKLIFKDQNIFDVIKEFSEKKGVLEKEIVENIYPREWKIRSLVRKCIGSGCTEEEIIKKLGCSLDSNNSSSGLSICPRDEEREVVIKQRVKISDLILNNKYIGVYTYGEANGSNPIVSDNKIKVISEKVSYKLGDKARILVRLPFSEGKVLLTHEKLGVINSEYIDVKGNTFFKEFVVDDTYMPNSYIGVVAIDTDKNKIPEYKVGYTEIVVDKNSKKSDLEIKTNKKVYSPKEEVLINIKSKKNSEVSLMVVDDSLVSLMGNIDLNILQRFYKKLPFQIQTSITNIVMLKNYYFSRPGIVGGSGFANFKGGDSSVSTRNLFKNTAYYNPSIITDSNGKASVKFNLPDNLTNFRIIAVSNSINNFFGVSEEFIEVRKNVIIEDKTPIILRDGDKLKVGANIFNNTDKEINFKVSFVSDYVKVKDTERQVKIPGNNSSFLTWDIESSIETPEISYKITALGDSVQNSDKIENTIKLKVSPTLVTNFMKNEIIAKGEKSSISIDIPENTNLDKSALEVFISNNKLQGIEKIVSSLARYPYGCIEQTVSSTYPNAILLKFGNLYKGIVKTTRAEKNLELGIKRIISMQTKDGGFAYWEGSDISNLHITPYVLRRLVSMKKLGGKVPNELIEKAEKYLSSNFEYITQDVDRAETFLSFASMGKGQVAYDKLIKNWNKNNINRHSLIAYTYGLIYLDKVKYKEEIDNNIIKIKNLLDKTEKLYRYWSDDSDKAIYTSMLIDYGYSMTEIDDLISELYNKDWNSYYYSTTTKNNSFVAFTKYIEKYGKNKYNLGTILVGDTKKGFELGDSEPNFAKYEFALSDVIKDNKIEVLTTNKSGNNLFLDVILKQFPKNKLLVKKYSNGMTIQRKIYKVIDENKLSECSEARLYQRNKVDCSKVLELNDTNSFVKGALYKIKVEVSLNENKERRNLVIEDFLPSTFRVINDRFKTESSIIKQNTTSGYRWTHKELLPDRIFATASYIWDNKAVFEYFVIPEFEGTFTYPPVTSYMMYNPKIRANGLFKIIEVK